MHSIYYFTCKRQGKMGYNIGYGYKALGCFTKNLDMFEEVL